MRAHLTGKQTVILICVVFTLLTVISSITGLLQGQTADAHVHIIMRFVVTVVGVSSILIFRLFPKWPLAAIYGLHYTATMGTIILLLWLSRLFIDLHPNAYKDIFFNFTPVYILIAIAFMVIGRNKKRSST
ncbi:hypothetical protein GCM10012290_17880 [Halolactibacillus alkaliphilus]|uniref:EamA domain-containing protein n=1 Tax=Halolactibacillus alkaliphilus TaxID=442899 RepID=A0A511X2H7_9BACI|nr:DUF6608 family protein [Halolactibacillus alkaliphilus]GEN57143.1 hypothetical protein HAL01_16070 [Halolactibacillus alkaliphilus]GGN72164.1 hypothetical protein GCM10012290_17880 [Halolactibacillus alkaliphilus]SFO88211.1 hypothetical protein SAMN05720591_11929 [Halolactibacillus alkaliphilus]